MFINFGAMILLILLIALRTPFPLNLLRFLSLNSNASYFPVDAPDGTIAVNKPLLVRRLTLIVGFPRESKTSFAFIDFIGIIE